MAFETYSHVPDDILEGAVDAAEKVHVIGQIMAKGHRIPSDRPKEDISSAVVAFDEGVRLVQSHGMSKVPGSNQLLLMPDGSFIQLVTQEKPRGRIDFEVGMIPKGEVLFTKVTMAGMRGPNEALLYPGTIKIHSQLVGGDVQSHLAGPAVRRPIESIVKYAKAFTAPQG